MKRLDKNFKTIMPNNLSEYASFLGTAIWFYLWCVARTTKEIEYKNDPTRYGCVLGSMPICSENLREDFADFSRWTFDGWRKKCVKANLIRAKRTPNGYIIEVIKSVKFPNTTPDKREMWSDVEKTSNHTASDVEKKPNHFDKSDAQKLQI
jgi:hypothetical protein